MAYEPIVEMYLGEWVDITSDVYVRDGVTITRGRSDEASAADPSRCTLTLNNRSGKYSPRNPEGPYYGIIGRNTPIRVRVDSDEDNYLFLPGTQFASDRGNDDPLSRSYAFTPHHSSLAIPGDIDIRVDIEPCSWRPRYPYGLAQRWVEDFSLGYLASWRFWLDTEGYLVFAWSPDGFFTEHEIRSSEPVPEGSGRLAVRVTRNQAAGTFRFFTAPDLSSSYVQLGVTSDAVEPGVATWNGDADIYVGSCDAEENWDSGLQGKLYGFEIQSSTGTKAFFDARSIDTYDTGVTDLFGREWSFHGNAVMANPSARFHGEVSRWPARWDTTDTDRWVPIEAGGAMTRLGQPTAPLHSVMRRAMTADDASGVVAYWPCEDDEGADEFASALPGGYPMLHPSGPTTNATYDGWKASAPLPQASSVQWTGRVPTYTVTGETRIRFFLNIPGGGVGSSGATVLRVRTTGSANLFELTVTSAGNFKFWAYNADDVLFDESLFWTVGANGKRLYVVVSLEQTTPTTVEYTVSFTDLATGNSDVFFNTLVGSRTVGRVRTIAMNHGGLMSEVAMGHISLENTFTPMRLGERLQAMRGEIAPARVLRLCREEGIPVGIVGDSSEGTALNYQYPSTLLDMLRLVSESDMGILYEPREFFGLAYRVKDSIYAQEAALTLDYENSAVTEIEPVEDDSDLRNDVTASRDDGGSSRVRQMTGPLAAVDPPVGVGKYEGDVTISVQRDGDLRAQAYWRLHLGTVDEPRYPTIGLSMSTAEFANSAPQLRAATKMDLGDRMVITNPPEGAGTPEEIQQIVQGVTESWVHPQWTFDLNCTPASPWNVARWDDTSGAGEARYTSDGTVLASAAPKTGAALVLPGTGTARAFTPDHASVDIVGDLDVRVHLAMDDWTPSSTQNVISKSLAAGNQRSWQLNVNSTGNLVLLWSTTGSGTLSRVSTANLGALGGGVAVWIRATLDVDNGSGQHVVQFYTSTYGDVWTPLGSAVTTAGATSIFNSTAELAVGAIDAGATNRLAGQVFAAEVRSGIDGTVAARVEFGAQAAGATSFVDDQGHTWTIAAPAVIADSAVPVGHTLNINTPSGPVWVDDDAPYDLMIGGERVTVLSVEGTGASQTMGVLRSRNGVRKAHAVGATVELAKPGIYAL